MSKSITELREALESLTRETLTPGAVPSDSARFEMVSAALDELEALRAVIDRLQWGSCDGCGNFNHCPECHAYRATWSEAEGYDALPGQHATECAVGKALKMRVPATS